MPTPASPAPIRLAPPGAGLPQPELFFANILFHWFRLKTSRAAAANLIAAERDTLLRLARNLEPAVGARQVLIPRLRGLEDSSRHWSVYMVLEHLRIVNCGIAHTIGLLATGQAPDRAASTAAVKPAPGIDASILPVFSQSCDAILRAAEAVPDLRTAKRYAHPWFGALDANGWHTLAGFHLRLHRKQAQAILTHL